MRGSRFIKVPLTVERLRELLAYDQESGVFTWKIARCNVKAGAIAGRCWAPANYRYIRIDNHDYLAARLAVFHVIGEWPKAAVKYEDRDRTNLSFKNLSVGRYMATQFNHKTSEGRSAYGRAHRKANPDLHKDKYLQRDFGLSLEEYIAMSVSQGGVCAICEQPEHVTWRGAVKMLSVDHNHTTGKVRGLLCNDCNHMIGQARESRDRFLSAIRYLDKHSGAAKPAVMLKEAK